MCLVEQIEYLGFRILKFLEHCGFLRNLDQMGRAGDFFLDTVNKSGRRRKQ